MGVKGGAIILYCKTRWTTAYKSISDVIRLKAVLENVCKTATLALVEKGPLGQNSPRPNIG